MKKIKLELLTERGKEAYKEIENTNISRRERMIEKAVAKEKRIDETHIEITFKISWLADQLEFDEKVIETFSMKGCERDLDYILEVE